ncbi:MAG: hypothetical protein ACM3SY_11945 [Candidatus Omnitrophota bacterium]
MICRNISILILFLWVGVIVSAEPVIRVTAMGHASPDVTPISKARALALRAARVEGYQKLVEALGKNKQTPQLLKGAQILSQRYVSDYQVEIVMEIALPQQMVPSAVTRKDGSASVELSDLKNELKWIKEQLNMLTIKFNELSQTVNVMAEDRKNSTGKDEDMNDVDE